MIRSRVRNKGGEPWTVMSQEIEDKKTQLIVSIRVRTNKKSLCKRRK